MSSEAVAIKDFYKKPFEDFDRSFSLILLLSLLIHFGVVGYFIINPLPTTVPESTIKSIQNKFATLVLDREVEAISAVKTLVPDRQIINEQVAADAALRRGGRRGSPPPSGGGEGGAPSSAASGARGESGALVEGSGGGTGGEGLGRSTESSRRALQSRVEQQVANQGLLGILTSRQGSGSGDGLAGGQVPESSDQVFANLDRMGSAGSGTGRGQGTGTGSGSGSGVRGGRATEGGNIDGYVGKLGTTQSFGSGPGSGGGTGGGQRNREFIIEDLAPVTDGEEGDGGTGGRGGMGTAARDVDEVATIVLSHNPSIQYCYEREIRRNPDLKGKVVVRFTITPEGKAINPKIISSTLGNDAVERCILSRISRWDDFGAIDPSLGNATFRQTYTFGF